jgi:c-di-GMP-binding flagellar brake protein YcgR
MTSRIAWCDLSGNVEFCPEHNRIPRMPIRIESVVMSHGNDSTENQRYLVTNTKEVLQILNGLIKSKTMLTASIDHGHNSFLTAVIAVDESKQLAYLDIGRDEEFNAHIAESKHITISNNDGIKIHWSSPILRIATLTDGQAICIGLPKDMVRVQRREYFRHPVPSRGTVICKMPYIVKDASMQEEPKILELALVDISIGGIGVVAPSPLNEALSLGAHFDHCKIELPGVGTTDLTLCIRHIRHIEMLNGIVQNRIGLEFINPSRGNQALLQRYTFILESESIALADGN